MKRNINSLLTKSATRKIEQKKQTNLMTRESKLFTSFQTRLLTLLLFFLEFLLTRSLKQHDQFFWLLRLVALFFFSYFLFLFHFLSFSLSQEEWRKRACEKKNLYITKVRSVSYSLLREENYIYKHANCSEISRY